MRRQTPTPVCVVEREYSVRQPPVFIAPPLPARAQVVILARTWMGPYSTRVPIARAGQVHVILSMACTATLKEVRAPPQSSQIYVPFVTALQQTALRAHAGVWSVRVPQGSFVIRRMEEVRAGRLASVHLVILKKRVTKCARP